MRGKGVRVRGGVKGECVDGCDLGLPDGGELQSRVMRRR